MHPSEFFICYTSELSDIEINVVNKYWDFGDTIDTFKYGTSELSSYFNGSIRKTHVANIAKKLGYLGSSRHLSCPACKNQSKIYSRSELKSHIRFKKNCNVCIKHEIHQLGADYIKSLNQYINNFEFPQNIGSPKDLSYVESIYLIQLLNNCNDQNLANFNNYISCEEFDVEITDALLNKNFLFKYKDQDHENLEHSKYLNFFRNKRNNLDVHQLVEFGNLMSRLPEFGLYLLIPTNYNSYEFHQELLVNLSTNELSTGDLKDIEHIIRSTLKYKALRITEYVEKFHKINVNKDEKFNHVVQYGLWNYSMMEIYSILLFQAERVAAEIHSDKLHKYNQPHALTKKVDNYFSYLINHPEKSTYPKSLPNSILNSEIETFTSRYIFENTLNWISLSGKEIMNRWINNPKIQL